eukprot:3581814-Pleurochrysis_carterae.AAC.1
MANGTCISSLTGCLFVLFTLVSARSGALGLMLTRALWPCIVWPCGRYAALHVIMYGAGKAGGRVFVSEYHQQWHSQGHQEVNAPSMKCAVYQDYAFSSMAKARNSSVPTLRRGHVASMIVTIERVAGLTASVVALQS